MHYRDDKECMFSVHIIPNNISAYSSCKESVFSLGSINRKFNFQFKKIKKQRCKNPKIFPDKKYTHFCLKKCALNTHQKRSESK